MSLQVSTGLAEEGADVDKLMARMDELQTQIDAANGWEIERTLQRATDALRCPPGLHQTQAPRFPAIAFENRQCTSVWIWLFGIH